MKGTNVTALGRKIYEGKKTNLFHSLNSKPRLDTIERIAEALEMKLSELIALGEDK